MICSQYVSQTVSCGSVFEVPSLHQGDSEAHGSSTDNGSRSVRLNQVPNRVIKMVMCMLIGRDMLESASITKFARVTASFALPLVGHRIISEHSQRAC